MNEKHDEHGGVWKATRGICCESGQVIRDIYMAHTDLGSGPAIIGQLGTMFQCRRYLDGMGLAQHRYLDRR